MNETESIRLRRMASVWFADIVGVSSLTHTDEEAGPRLVKIFQEVAVRVVEQEFEGRVVKFKYETALAEFTSTEAAVRSAVELMELYQQEARAEGYDSSLRVGVHLGEVVATSGGDIFGEGVTTAAHLHGRAAPGQVLVSEDVWRQLRTRAEFRFESVGEVELQGITARIAVFDVLFGSQTALGVSRAGSRSAGLSAAQTGSSRRRTRRYPVRAWHVAALVLTAMAGGVGLHLVGLVEFGFLRGPPRLEPGLQAAPPDSPSIDPDLLFFPEPEVDGPQSPAQEAVTAGPSVEPTVAAPVESIVGAQAVPEAATPEADIRDLAPRIAGGETEPAVQRAPTIGDTSHRAGAAGADVAQPSAEPPADPRLDRELAVQQAMEALQVFPGFVERHSEGSIPPEFGLGAVDRQRLESACAGGPIHAAILSPQIRRLDEAGAYIDFLLVLTATRSTESKPLPFRAFVVREPSAWRLASLSARY